MINSIVSIYKTRIIPEKRMIVENLDSYLESCPKATIADFVYIKIAQSIELKLNLPIYIQENEGYFNYLKVKDSNSSKTFYFFIDSVEWIAEMTIRISARMDVLNTFSLSLLSGNLLGERTRMIREHRNRYKRKNSLEFLPIIDRISEGSSYPMRRVGNLEPIKEKAGLPFWSIAYYSESTDARSPILAEALPSKNVSIKAPQGDYPSNVIFPNFSNFSVGDIYFVARPDNAPESSNLVNVQVKSPTEIYNDFQIGATKEALNRIATLLAVSFEIKSVSSETAFLSFKKYWYFDDLTLAEIEGPIEVGLKKSLSTNVYLKCGVYHKTASPNSPSSISSILNLPSFPFVDYILKKSFPLKTSKEIERTGSLLMKILEFPYSPFPFKTDGDGDLILQKGWAFDMGRLFFYEDDPDFSADFDHEILSEPIKEAGKAVPMSEFTAGTLWRKKDPKFFNSEFTSCKVIYDSFVWEWKFENYRPSENPSIMMRYRFSDSFLSEMIFQFRFKDIPSTSWVETMDFDRLIVSTRSLERPIFSVPYLDYLRTSYNYDLKKNSVQKDLEGLGIALSSINSGLSLASRFASGKGGGVVGGVAGVAGIGTSLLGDLVNFSVGAEMRGEALANSIRNLQRQGASVSGSSDYSIFRSYSNGYPCLAVYQPEPQFTEVIQKSFHLYGYACEKIGAPTAESLKSRIYFNFLQCDPDLSTEEGSRMQKWQREEMSSLLNSGITIFHERNGIYDFSQIYENSETLIFEE